MSSGEPIVETSSEVRPRRHRRRSSRLERRLRRAAHLAAPFLAVVALGLLSAGVVRTVEVASEPVPSPRSAELEFASSADAVDEGVSQAEPLDARDAPDAQGADDGERAALLAELFSETGSPAAAQEMLDAALAPALTDDFE